MAWSASYLSDWRSPMREPVDIQGFECITGGSNGRWIVLNRVGFNTKNDRCQNGQKLNLVYMELADFARKMFELAICL